LWRGEAAPTCNDSHDDDPRRRLSQLRRGVGKRAAILPRTRRFFQGTTSKINAPRRGPVKASRRAPGGPAVWAKLAKLWPRVVPVVSPWRCAARQSMPPASSSPIRWLPSHAGALLLCCSAALLRCYSACTPQPSTPPTPPPTPLPAARCPLPACACPTRRPTPRPPFEACAERIPRSTSVTRPPPLRPHAPFGSFLSFFPTLSLIPSFSIVDSFALYPGYTPHPQWPQLPHPPRHGSSPATRASRTSSKISSAKILSVLRYVLLH
jgi:hypothetical protein